MKKKNHIQLVPNAHIPCMRIWCGHCKTMVKTCRENGKELSQCEHDQLQYRFVAFIPGTKTRIVRSVGKEFNSAVKQVAILRQQLADGEIQHSTANQKQLSKETPVRQNPPQVSPQTKPVLLTHVFGKYLATLKGEGVPNHMKLVRSKSHTSDVKNCFNQFCLALTKKKYDLRSFQLTDVSNDAIGVFHDWLISKEYSDTTYNRFFSHLGTFASWAEREEYGDIKKYIDRVQRKTVTPHPEIITNPEFEKLLSVISYENGFQYGIGKRKETRNHFRGFLVPSFICAAITGRRVEEILTCRFSDVHTDEHGRPVYITFTDHKVSRILHVAPGEEREVHTPATNEIRAFLNAQGFQKKKSTNDFILSPEIVHNRIASMRMAISRGFSHYWKVAYPDSTREVSFKTLRKTYLTKLAIRMGKENVPGVSGHSSQQILKNYINEEQVAIAASLDNFSVLGKGAALKAQRKKSRNNQLTIER